jgi:hypothetical protein
MAKRKRKPIPALELETPTLAQLANGDFERDFVTHTETNTKATVHRRRDACVVGRWMREGGQGFDHGACRIITDCQSLWLKVGEPRLIAHYGERMPSGGLGDGMGQKEALDQLHYFKTILGARLAPFWDVFEAVVRHNEPAGVAGSRFANNPPQRIQSAKVITGMVASHLASRMGY